MPQPGSSGEFGRRKCCSIGAPLAARIILVGQALARLGWHGIGGKEPAAGTVSGAGVYGASAFVTLV